CLMATSRFLTVSEIGDMVEGYEPGRDGDEHEAFRRMFERDKQYLRDLGIPLETGADSYGDEVGYRIRRNADALPEIRLSPDAAGRARAGRGGAAARGGAPAAGARRRPAAGGAAPSPALGPGPGGDTPGGAAGTLGPAELFGLDGLEPRVDATEAAFEPCLAA